MRRSVQRERSDMFAPGPLLRKKWQMQMKSGLNRLIEIGAQGVKVLAILVGVVGVSLLLVYLAGTFHAKVPTSVEKKSRSIPSGETKAQVLRLRQPRYETAVGSIQPIHESTISSKILAKVQEINIQAGQRVEAGQVLIRLNAEDLQARQKQAEAELESVRATLQLAERELSRAKQLLPTRSISQSEFESAQTNQLTAKAQLDRVSRSLEEAKVFVGYATISAPFSGIVVDRFVEQGDTVGPGQKLISIYDPQQMQLVANVRESLASRLQVGQNLPASIESLNLHCEAMVREVVPQSDRASRTFLVKVSGPCPQGVYSGMFGRLHIPLEDEEWIVVPTEAIRRVGQITFVHVVHGEEWERRAVQLGRSMEGRTEVLSGLSAGEEVLIPSRAIQGGDR